MKPIIVILIPFLLGLLELSQGAPGIEAQRSFASVQVRRLVKRSLDQSAEVPSYQVQVEAFGKEHQLNLEVPSSPIFTPSFQYLEARADPVTGEVQLNDATPSEEELRSIEGNFFTDPASNAAVSLKQASNDGTSFQLSGRISDQLAIRPDESSNGHEVVKNGDDLADSSKPREDYVDLKRTLTLGKQSRATSYATPEVLVIFDYANTRLFGGTRTKILDYLGVFFHAINNRYATASDPKITFKLSGVTTISTLSAQPYMENNKVPGGYNIDQVLTDLSKWAGYSNSRSTPRYDLIALITGTDMKMKDSSGNYASGVAGLAYLKAACWNSTQLGRYLGASVTEDIGGFYDGMFSVAHELAHNMGAPHDGDNEASSCPWSNGYIMSYEGWGTKNKFYFSPCSLQLMKNMIDSQEGTCVRTTQSSSTIPLSNDNIGDRLSMQQLCVKYTNSTQAVPDPDTSAGDLCKNLKCRYPHPTNPGWYMIRTMNHPPGDDTPCGNTGGICYDGDCVVPAR